MQNQQKSIFLSIICMLFYLNAGGCLEDKPRLTHLVDDPDGDLDGDGVTNTNDVCPWDVGLFSNWGCDRDHFVCRDHQESIRETDRCDGFVDCKDQSDEKIDGHICFMCDNGKKIKGDFVCDGANDCSDGSDEDSCG